MGSTGTQPVNFPITFANRRRAGFHLDTILGVKITKCRTPTHQLTLHRADDNEVRRPRHAGDFKFPTESHWHTRASSFESCLQGLEISVTDSEPAHWHDES